MCPPSIRPISYDVLGRLAIENRRRYCDAHGYDFISDVPIARDRPACWAKIPAILAAFEAHEWVLWADSDALILDQTRTLEEWCGTGHELIVQGARPVLPIAWDPGRGGRAADADQYGRLSDPRDRLDPRLSAARL